MLADAHGGARSTCCERECSIQRRHQKVVEETPSPALDAAQRARAAARRAWPRRAPRLRERGHGRVPARRRTARFYFLEMNTRLQVEHPVTEAVTGLDLVRLQIEIAAGRPLPFAQDGRVAPRPRARVPALRGGPGAATTCPRPGRILHLARARGPGRALRRGRRRGLRGHASTTTRCWPRSSPGAATARSRSSAWRRRCARTVVLGVATNLARLQAIVDAPAFRAGRAAHRLPRRAPRRASRGRRCPPPEALAAAAGRAAAASQPAGRRRAGRAGSLGRARRLAARRRAVMRLRLRRRRARASTSRRPQGIEVSVRRRGVRRRRRASGARHVRAARRRRAARRSTACATAPTSTSSGSGVAYRCDEEREGAAGGAARTRAAGSRRPCRAR